MEKDEARRMLLNCRKAMSEEMRKKAGTLLSQHLIAFPLIAEANLPVFLYHPQGTEADVRPAILALLENGRTVGLPRVEGDDLVFLQIRSLENDLEEGAYHLMEPRRQCQKLPADEGVCIVPGLGFDRRGGRIGHGKGYYDRFLNAHPALVRIGAAFFCQTVETLPMDVSDAAMDWLATERGVYQIGKERKAYERDVR